MNLLIDDSSSSREIFFPLPSSEIPRRSKLSEENLKKSAEEGASYYAPKDEIAKIDLFVADVIEARDKKKSSWAKVFERLGGFYDRRFGGTDWREKEKEFWEKKVKSML